MEGVKVAVRQKGNRADYTYDEDLGGVALSNYSYSFKDESAKTYVMTYAVNDEGFVKTDERCSKDFQCFENAAKDKRLIVTPYEVSFNHCQALLKDECSYDPLSQLDGVMVSFKKDEEWTSYVLGGEVRYYGGGFKSSMQHVRDSVQSE